MASFCASATCCKVHSQKDVTVHGSFVRLGTRYRLTIDSADAPRGGFCDWRPDWIAVDPRLQSNVVAPDTAVGLKPIHALYGPSERPVAKFPAVVRCGKGKYNARCNRVSGILEDSSEEVHLSLDVLYDDSYVPPQG